MASVNWENPDNNRYYIAVLQKDLLQDWILQPVMAEKAFGEAD